MNAQINLAKLSGYIRNYIENRKLNLEEILVELTNLAFRIITENDFYGVRYGVEPIEDGMFELVCEWLNLPCEKFIVNPNSEKLEDKLYFDDSCKVNTKTLSQLIRQKRGKRQLKEIVKEINNMDISNVYRNNLIRVDIVRAERGDIFSKYRVLDFFSFCKWLKIDPKELIIIEKSLTREEEKKQSRQWCKDKISVDIEDPKVVNAFCYLVDLAHDYPELFEKS